MHNIKFDWRKILKEVKENNVKKPVIYSTSLSLSYKAVGISLHFNVLALSITNLSWVTGPSIVNIKIKNTIKASTIVTIPGIVAALKLIKP